MAVKFAAWGNAQFVIPSTGAPASGYLLYTYVAGSSTPVTTYTTSAGNVAQSNPIVLNSAGFPTTGQIWITEGTSIKIVFTDPSDVVIKTEDNIPGANDSTSTADQWVASGLTPTYVSATSFTLVGDQTTAFHVGRRLKTTNSGGTIYSTITVSAYAAVTTITVVNDSGTLDSGLSAVSYGLLTATNPSTPLLTDAYPIVSGSSDKTKKLSFEIDGFTTATTRVITVTDQNIGLFNSSSAYLRQAFFTGVATVDIDLTAATMPAGWSTFARSIVIIRSLLPTNDAVGLDLRVSVDGGATFLSGASDYGWARLAGTAAATATTTDEADSEINLAVNIGNASDNENVSLVIEIVHLAGVGPPCIFWKSRYLTATPAQGVLIGGGQVLTSAATITDIQLLITAGTMTSEYTVYAERGS